MIPLIGYSVPMQALGTAIRKAASDNVDVLILGESGTGKELVAQAIHQYSRGANPFVAVNCAALNDNIVENELFGHERGAFTGADRQKKGKFEVAHRGTIFLDEIGEISAVIQAKLLRVLQMRHVDRLGGADPVSIDVRVIAATNRDLPARVARGQFRADLFYRLNVFTVRTPALRERIEDVRVLAEHFVRKYGSCRQRPVSRVAPEAVALLQRHSWPGNVREFENVVHRAVIDCEDDTLQVEHLPKELRAEDTARMQGAIGNYYAVMDDTARRLLSNALAMTGGNDTQAAQLIGIHPKSMYRLRRRLGICFDVEE